jgi:hypothetical protein
MMVSSPFPKGEAMLLVKIMSMSGLSKDPVGSASIENLQDRVQMSSMNNEVEEKQERFSSALLD